MLPVILSKFVLKEHQKEPVFPRGILRICSHLWHFPGSCSDFRAGLCLWLEKRGTEQARQVPSPFCFSSLVTQMRQVFSWYYQEFWTKTWINSVDNSTNWNAKRRCEVLGDKPLYSSNNKAVFWYPPLQRSHSLICRQQAEVLFW